MKKMTGVAIFMLILTFMDCETKTGFDVNLQCWTKHTSEVINVESGLLGAKDQVFINLTWGWTLQRPTVDAIIVDRSIGDLAHFTAIDTQFNIDSVMICNDADTVLEPNTLVYYQLNSLYGASVTPFCTIDVNVPAAQHFTRPASDTLSIADDTLVVSFSHISGLDTTDIAIYAGAPTSIDSLLNFLTNPLYSTTTADTILSIPGADSLFPADTIVPYTIRISSSSVALLDWITDTSVGFKAFVRLSKKE
jgi:hypothetical protein